MYSEMLKIPFVTQVLSLLQDGDLHARKFGPQTEAPVHGDDQQNPGGPAAEASEHRQQSDQAAQGQLNPVQHLPNGKNRR